MVDAIDMAYEIFVREVSVTLSKSSDLRIFFHHDFHVNGNDIGDTTLYDPLTSSIIHYKRDKWFLFKCDISSTEVLPEQIAPNGSYTSVAPLVWSHAELIRTIYMLKHLSIEIYLLNNEF